MKTVKRKLGRHLLGVNMAALLFSIAIGLIFDIFTALISFPLGLILASFLVYLKNKDQE